MLLGSLLLLGGLVVASGVLAQPPEPSAGQTVQGAAARSEVAALAASDVVPPAISYQGRLTDPDGNPLDGTYDMQFQLWDAESGGSQVGSTISVNDVDVDQGLFNVRLEVNSADFDGQALWLRVRAREDGGSWDPWMTPRQQILPAPYALSLRPGADIEYDDALAPDLTVRNGYPGGVWLVSKKAIAGWTSDGVAVWGAAGAGQGVYGISTSPNGVGVYAEGSGSTGTALKVRDGAIEVDGAGLGTDTPVFIHEATAGNITCGLNHCTQIDHPLTNGDPDAILIVTQNWNPEGVVAGTYNDHPIGVWYDSSDSKWEIFNQDFAAMPAGAAFNVLVVKP